MRSLSLTLYIDFCLVSFHIHSGLLLFKAGQHGNVAASVAAVIAYQMRVNVETEDKLL